MSQLKIDTCDVKDMPEKMIVKLIDNDTNKVIDLFTMPKGKRALLLYKNNSFYAERIEMAINTIKVAKNAQKK